MSIWNKFTAWISGWPEGSKERIQKQEVQKGSNSKDKKIRKQGNIT